MSQQPESICAVAYRYTLLPVRVAAAAAATALGVQL
jgi:hypothetical protein